MLLFKRIFITVIILATSCSQLVADSFSWIDSIMDLPAIILPVVQYSPETKWVFGGAAQGYFRCKDQSKTSVVQLNGAYSLARQWYIKTKGNIYFGNHHNWQITYDLGYRDYPDTWYETGNEFKIKTGQSYNSRRFHITFQPYYYFSAYWAVGLNINGFTETSSLTMPIYSSRSEYIGIGAVIQYDSRDISFYPNKGMFFKFSCSDYESLNSNYKRAAYIDADFRHYISIYRDLIFAWQCKTKFVWRSDNVPYSLLPTLGGEDLLRGVRANMFRDNTLWALQCELRFPIWKIIHGTAFAGVGDVYNINHLQWAIPKAGYGLGLRASINKVKINIRFDVARNNLNNSWNTLSGYSFYFTATEAF